jgi:hypothetical protein
MKMRITVTDEDGWALASHVFEIAGLNDYQQATNYIRDRVRETLANRDNPPSIELSRKLEPPVKP